MAEELSWRDPERGQTVVMREGLAADAVGALAAAGWSEFELLSTERALSTAPELGESACAVNIVPAGQVPETAAAVLEQVGSERLVALGGGRVIDTSKAVAAMRGGRVAAIPTTLSGAEMTAIHRLPAGGAGAAGVRPALVLADPVLMASAPELELHASAINALAHGADSLYTPLADGRSRELALEGAALLARSLDAGRDERQAAELALGSLRCAEALDRAGLALHHVLSQTSVRLLGTPHAETNAALLPVTMEEMAGRAPEPIAALAEAIGATDSLGGAGMSGAAEASGGAEASWDVEVGGDAEAGEIGSARTSGRAAADPRLGAAIRARIEGLAGGRRALGELGADAALIDEVVAVALARPELARMTPGEVTAADLRRLLERAW